MSVADRLILRALIKDGLPSRAVQENWPIRQPWEFARVIFDREKARWHQIYLARGKDIAGNQYGDPGKSHEELMRARLKQGDTGH